MFGCSIGLGAILSSDRNIGVQNDAFTTAPVVGVFSNAPVFAKLIVSFFAEFGVVEDKFIFGDFNILKNISNVYEYVKKLKFDDENFYSEKLIGEYFVENFKEHLEFIDGINIINNINHKKYSHEIQLIVESLYNTCN